MAAEVEQNEISLVVVVLVDPARLFRRYEPLRDHVCQSLRELVVLCIRIRQIGYSAISLIGRTRIIYSNSFSLYIYWYMTIQCYCVVLTLGTDCKSLNFIIPRVTAAI